MNKLGLDISKYLAGERKAWPELTERIASEPACWSWELPSKTEDEVRAGLASGTGDNLMSRRTIDRILVDWPGYWFIEFHAERCAICEGGGRLVIDHDHTTGLVRGLLCVGCNVAEGMSRLRIFRAYRERNPATILGFESLYHEWSGSPLARVEAIGIPPRLVDLWRDNPMRNVGL